MKVSNFRNYKTIVIIISIFSFIISVWQSQFVYDGHHWGLMTSNATDLLRGKLPYKEIFIQYGLFTTIIHSIFMKIGGMSVISIFFFTSLIYSISIYYFFLIIKDKFQTELALFGVICIFLIHPFVNHPWHNYLTFFFLLLSLFFLGKDDCKHKLISGIFFSLAVLSYEKFLIIFLFFFISYFFINLKNQKLKNSFFLLIGFAVPLLIFFFYLLYYQILDDWIKYHYIGALYIGENHFFVILNFLINLTQQCFKKFIFEPYWLFFLILLISNTVLLCLFLIKKNFLKKEEEYLIYFSVISIVSFSSAIHSLNSFRLATGSIIGILILIYFIDKIKNSDTRNFVTLSLIVILCLGINFKKSENNKLFITPVSFEHYTNNEIKFFNMLKLKKDTWEHIIYFNNKIIEIKQKCPDVIYAINYTNNNYYYLLISDIFETFQIKPWINEKNTLDRNIMALINPNLERSLIKKVLNNKTIIVANLSYKIPQNYSSIDLPYSYEDKYKEILIPKNCKNKL